MAQDLAVRLAPSLAPEHDWAAAARLLHPALRPIGTAGTDGQERHVPQGVGMPLIAPGPAGLPIVYVIPADGFGVLVGMEHLLAWGVGPEQVHAAAMTNLAVWSAEASWMGEVEGRRQIVWSDCGGGMDAARILLDEVRDGLVSRLAAARRIIVGLPERDLLIAAGLADGDDEFASLFAGYVGDRAGSADEPIDGRVFELVDGELVALEADLT